MKIQIAGRVADSIVDGPGIRYALFTQGCPRSCPGCHNPQTQDPNGGFETTTEKIFEEIRSDPLLDGVTFSGGEPFLQPLPLIELAKEIHKINLNVIVYTGYCWEELLSARNKDWDELLAVTDVLVDGPFIQSLRDWQIKFAGSSNQRFIDVQKSLEQNKLIQLDSLDSMPNVG